MYLHLGGSQNENHFPMLLFPEDVGTQTGNFSITLTFFNLDRYTLDRYTEDWVEGGSCVAAVNAVH